MTTETVQERMTGQQQRLLLAIRVYQRKHGCSPSLRDLMAACEFSSTSMTRFYLDQLRALGLVEWQDGKARTIRLVKAGRAS